MKKLTPKEYFTKQFRDDFYAFIKGARVHERDGDLYIPIQNLNRKLLSHVPEERLVHFYYSLAFTTLIDSIMQEYFDIDYPEFQAMTQYPKFEEGISGLRVTPWQLAELDFKPLTFKEFSRFFLDDQKDFFHTHIFKVADWKGIIQAMLEDPDLQKGIPGEVFIMELKEHVLN